MSIQKNNQPAKASLEVAVLGFALGLVFVVTFPLWCAVVLGSAINGVNRDVQLTPVAVVFGLMNGKVVWPESSTPIVVVLLILVLALVVALTIVAKRYRGKKTRVDIAASRMGRGKDIHPLTEPAVTAVARRLGVTDSIGLPLGVLVNTPTHLFSSWEDMRIHIWGPRTGKTTSQAIPSIMAAPGACVVTSNKRDVHDATRLPRSAFGPIWVFDPQGIAGETPTWWWNPLSVVVDDVTAAELASHFAAGTKAAGAKEDAFFDPEGQELLACLLLAAALDQRPISDVFTWVTRPTDDEGVLILRQHGWDGMANSLEGIINSADKQRSGVYGTAKKMASSLKIRSIGPWIERQGVNDRRTHFDVDEFVRSKGTLYSLSREGKGSAGPLIAALTAFTAAAAEKYAVTQPGGRLAVPMYFGLDEAANVCRWMELPNLYSHYGSRGIIIDVILQSYSQGAEVWGDKGMAKMYSAANIATYGGGVKEVSFLRDASELIGDYRYESRSNTTSRQGTSTAISMQRERIFDVSSLSALPKGRAVVFASGTPPVLIRTAPWMTGPHAASIRASILKFDPKGSDTLREAEQELLIVQHEEEQRMRMEAAS